MAPTMWGTISFLSDEILRVGEGLKDTVLEELLPFKATMLKLIVDNQLGSSKETSDSVLQILGKVMKTLVTLTEDGEAVKAAVAELKASTTSGRKVRRDSVDDIMGMTGRLNVEEDGSVDEDGGKHDAMRPVASISIIVEQPVFSAEILNMVHTLMEDVKQVKNSADSSTIKFGRLGLCNV
jgi:hypothetical protein